MKIWKYSFAVISCVLFFTASQAQHYVPFETPEHALTKAQVRSYIKTEFAVNKLQKRLQKKKAIYGLDSIISIFFRKREKLLIKRGWNPEKYEELRDRVFAAKNNIKAYKEYQKDKANGKLMTSEKVKKLSDKKLKMINQTISMVRANAHLPAEQKKKMLQNLEKQKADYLSHKQEITQANIAGLKDQNKERMERMTYNKKDWPAVRAYMKTLKQLQQWYNGNTAHHNHPEWMIRCFYKCLTALRSRNRDELVRSRSILFGVDSFFVSFLSRKKKDDTSVWL